MDHGILNTPLRSRGNIDAQIDHHKATQAAAYKESAKIIRAELVADQATAKALFESMSVERLAQLAHRCNVSLSAMKKKLRSDSHWQPKLVISLLS
ncbi:hypothetical protein FJ973_29780 [Mesorhizobium sp. B2-1-3]|uniref:hypothetical protein n=1 Tax=Mesorhizobium sp. B2-1-3 TaxID=2589972 RepID=UPI00112AE159|nr:hypothetical protein [Mesorhizobium sp. B2-1-3]TPN03835.1 hypothetical protein FJ973_29780 [Mesorhizobium sp. B2-1-3]